MKKIYEKLDVETAIWWITLIVVFLVIPIVKVASGDLTINGESIPTPWWLYLVAVFIYDWFLIILAVTFSMISMMLTKLHNYFSGEP